MIGSNGLDLIGAGNTTVPELGQLGLLYLMFVAGVELDLALVRIHRRAVGLFGLLAFAVPMAFGSAIGFAMHWEVAGGASARLADGLAHAAGLPDGPQRGARRPPRRGHRRRGDGDHRYGLARRAGLRVRIAARGRIACVDRAAGGVRPGRAGRLLVPDPASAGPAGVPLPRDRPDRPLPAGDRRLPGRGHDRHDGRHRGHRRCVLRRPGAQPPGPQRGTADGPDRLLRVGRVRADLSRLGRSAAPAERDGSRRDAEVRGSVHRRGTLRQGRRGGGNRPSPESSRARRPH